MPRSPRAWWRAAAAGALTFLAAAGPAAATGRSAPAAPPAPPGQESSFVVGKAVFEPLDGALPVGVQGIGDYRGNIEIVPDGRALAAINDVAVEDYVDGISEMPSNWPAAALRAQAIAARTYLLHSVASPSPELRAIGAQICSDQDCQVYAGLAKAQGPHGQQWLDAVASTAGQALLYWGRPIDAMYSSSDGGRTVDGGEPYLRAVDDPDDSASPLNQWTVQAAPGEVARALQLPGSVTSISQSGDSITTTSATPPPSDQNQPAGGQPAQAQAAPSDTTTVPATAPTARNQTATTLPSPPTTAPTTSTSTTSTTSPPPTTAAPSTAPSAANPPASGPAPGGTQGSLTTSVADFTHRLNAALPPAAGRDVLIPSDRFDVTVDATNVTFSGRGFGHGIGMSQYGALGKANRGLSASDILACYYGGLRPQRLPLTAIPASVRVAVGRGLTDATVTGRFRLVDGNGNVLVDDTRAPAVVGTAPGGHIRVVVRTAAAPAHPAAPVLDAVAQGPSGDVTLDAPRPGEAAIIRATRAKRASMTAGVVVAVIGLLAVSAVIATALLGSRRPT